MERFGGNSQNPELGWETEVIFDDVVKREYERHPEHKSRRKRLIFIQETFGIWNPVELSHLIGVDEKTIRKFISRRGIRDTELEKVQEIFDGTYAITSIIEHHVEGLLARRDTLVKQNPLLGAIGIKEALKLGLAEEAVLIAERTFKHIHEQG